MSIKAIIFDFGQVITATIDPQTSNRHRARLAAQLGLDPAELWPYLFGGDLARQWMSGQMSAQEFWPAILAPRGITDPAAVDNIAENVFEEPIQANPEVRSLLFELAPDYKLAVLSNATWTTAELTELLENDLALPASLFDCILTSTSAGLAKPDPAFFRLVLSELDVRPQEAIFIDDIGIFTETASQIGLHSHTFTTPSALRAFLIEKGVL